MKAVAIVLVGGAAEIAADGIFGVLALLRLYIYFRVRPGVGPTQARTNDRDRRQSECGLFHNGF